MGLGGWRGVRVQLLGGGGRGLGVGADGRVGLGQMCGGLLAGVLQSSLRTGVCGGFV